MDYRGQTSLPRGIRDNNPGNMTQPSGSSWQGSVGLDGRFVIFSDSTWGLRALAKDLINNINAGVDTIDSFITKYAPPSENNTDAYIASVSSDSGIAPDDQLGTDQATITSLMRAIVNHENGDIPSQQYISDADISTGYTMAADPTTVFQGTAITAAAAVQANPGTSAMIALGAVAVLYLLFGGGGKRRD